MKPFNSFVEWAKANAHPVSSASEDNAEELSFLKSALADARVVTRVKSLPIMFTIRSLLGKAGGGCTVN